MWKQSMCGAVLAVAMGVPEAQAQRVWSFSYSGFEVEGVFDPGLRAEGAFVGSDRNGNGVIEQSELERFVWDGLIYELADGDYCYGSISCYLTGFRYSLDGQLDFSLDWQYRDEMGYAAGLSVAGDSIESTGGDRSGDSTGRVWRWTEQTRFAINPPPVPEPHQYLMLAGGLLAVAALRLPLRSAPSPRPASGIRRPPGPPRRPRRAG